MIDVTCAIIEHDGKVLLAQRSRQMHPPLKWEFPGGKIKSNENAEECVIREIKEELNISIEIVERLPSSLYNYGIKNINLIPFRASYISGKIKLLEHEQVKWVVPSDILKMDLAEADIPIVKYYLSKTAN